MLREELKKLEDSVKVVISNDKIEAYLEIVEDISMYCVADIIEFLNHHNVIYGIDEARIAVMLNEQEINKTVLVAKGTPASKGSDGFYKYFFNTEPVNGTIILEDGTVDYNMLGKMVLCNENDLLVEYYKAIPGMNGVSVTGAVIHAHPVKDLKPLKGKGFDMNEEDNCYYSKFDGKIDFDGNVLKVSQVYVIEGDVNVNTKPIKFCGDVIVLGNIFGDAKIEAVGNITVNGCVESATLLAGKNVLLKNGMQGNGKGYIFAKGDVSAKFFEQTTVVANGNINSNYILNCDMYANKKIIVSGRKGAIIGGNVRAIELISASVIGNTALLPTKVEIGVGNDYYFTIQSIEDKITKLQIELEELDKKLIRISDKIKDNPITLLINARNETIKEKIEKSAKYNEQCKLKEEIISQKQRSITGSIIVSGSVFPNTNVSINGISNMIRDCYRNVTLFRNDSEIRIYSNLHG